MFAYIQENLLKVKDSIEIKYWQRMIKIFKYDTVRLRICGRYFACQYHARVRKSRADVGKFSKSINFACNENRSFEK